MSDNEPSGSELTTTTEERVASTPRTPGFILAISVAVVFAVIALVFAVMLAGGDERVDASGVGSRVTSLREVAGQMGEAFFTYDYRDLDAHKERVLSLSTGSFRTEYDEEFERGLRGIITEVQSTSQGFVKDVYVSEIDEERAEAIVVLDVDQDGTGGPRTVFDVYVLLTFVEVDGTWKVDDVTDPKLPFGGGGGAATSTDATTTTTASVPVP